MLRARLARMLSGRTRPIAGVGAAAGRRGSQTVDRIVLAWPYQGGVRLPSRRIATQVANNRIHGGLTALRRGADPAWERDPTPKTGNTRIDTTRVAGPKSSWVAGPPPLVARPERGELCQRGEYLQIPGGSIPIFAPVAPAGARSVVGAEARLGLGEERSVAQSASTNTG